MKIRVYIDTNIYVYAIIHHPVYGEPCAEILRDIGKGLYEVYGSTLVAIELLGALSKIDSSIARRAVEDYLSLGINILEVNEDVIRLATIVNELTSIRYDSIHVALVLLNNIPVVITNDLDDWLKVSKNMHRIVEKIEEEGYTTMINELQVVPPKRYREWRKNAVAD